MPRSLLVLACGVLFTSGPQGQEKGRGVVRGEVRDEAGRALVGVHVSALGTARQDETEEGGTFRLTDLAEAPTRVVVRRLGFGPETLLVRPVPGDQTPSLMVRLRRLVQPLEAVIVRGRAEIRGPMSGFYDRRARGHGRFFTAEQIDRRNAANMSDLLRDVPGMRVQYLRGGRPIVRMRGAQMAPLVWLDGTPMSAGEVDLDTFDPRSFEGIEIYAGSGTTPVEFAGGRQIGSSGGTIVLWTKRGLTGPPRRKRGAPSPAEQVARLIERGEAFVAADVDVPVSPKDGLPIRPLYPDSLYTARQPGEIEVEFVVLSTGRMRQDTFSVISTTHLSLVEAVRRAVSTHPFIPAKRGGKSVSQLVQLPFSFRPDVELAERKDQE